MSELDDGISAFKNGELDKALQFFTKIAQRGTAKAEAHAWRARTYAAIESFEKVGLSLIPRHCTTAKPRWSLMKHYPWHILLRVEYLKEDHSMKRQTARIRLPSRSPQTFSWRL